MRVHRRQVVKATESLGERVWRLERLPVRAVTARAVLSALPEEPDDEWHDIPESGKTRSILELDPGWAQAISSSPGRSSALTLTSLASWWPATGSGGPAGEMIARLWRHSVAVSVAARWLARDGGDANPQAVARAGMLCRLGCWAIAAVDPDWLLRWWQDESRALRREREIAGLGTELEDLSRRLAERWGCDPLVIDAVWLASDQQRSLARCLAAGPAGVYPGGLWLGRANAMVAGRAGTGRDALGPAATNPGRRSSSAMRNDFRGERRHGA